MRIALWEAGVPGFEDRRDIPEVSQDWWTKQINDPSVHFYAADPEHANGSAVLIMPGGGHEELVTTTEGRDVAQWFAARGVAAFVLYYRLAREEGAPWTIEDARQDAERAMRLIRRDAGEFGVDPEAVGVMGFSAGGELARMTLLSPPDPPEGEGDALDASGDPQPDFGILVFPGPWAGEVEEIGPDTVPILLSTAADDECCAQPTIDIFVALRAGGAPAELHVYQEGGHAYNMGEATDLVSLQNWPGTIEDWMIDRGLMVAEAREKAVSPQ
ncbi:alpha/beta hydrolase [Alteraurantiacibacter aquimixticola]|uniref:alpha/beta hydrolase n=1 Tax=Alteraurantiacibacter aquimixticola TaxID=2489173 RepID=UPI001B7D776C|nr:alpha/beta hydrolase [Alteraurantiacibacter aquimixticola]